MNRRRILWHGLFWLACYSVTLFNELYLYDSFSKESSWEMFLMSASAQACLLVIKATVTYFLLYSLIPRWIAAPFQSRLVLEAVLTVMGGACIMRLFIHWVAWPHIYHVNVVDMSSMTRIGYVARFFYSLLDILQVAGVASAIKLFKLRIQAMQKERTLAQEKLRSEILNLKAQINPHFLFNTLNSLYALSRQQSPQTPAAVLRLSGLMRYMLYEVEKKSAFLKDEIQILEDYIALQRLRFGDRLVVQVERFIDDETARIAPLLLLPLVENAFKHGNSDQAPIRLKIDLEDDVLHVQISNPIAEESFRSTPGSGIGLLNLKRQLELLYKEFSFRHGPENGLYIVDLHIDLASYAQPELFDRRG